MDELDNFNSATFTLGDGLSGSWGLAGSAPAPASSSSGTDFSSGAFQSALALANTYMTKRLDIDLATRLAGMQPTVYRQGTQQLIGVDATTRIASGVGGMRLGDLLPMLLLAGGVWFLVRKG